MSRSNRDITRRRVMQGAGAIGLAGVIGSTTVTAQVGEDGNAEGAALRVAHASPDAPSVDVRLTATAGAGAAADQAGDGTARNETDAQDGGDDETTIDGLEFRNVSSYTEVEPGSYRVEVVPTDDGLLGGVVDDLFGDDESEEDTVLFGERIDVEEGTTYTVVAFGEIARGPVQLGDAGAGDGTETTPDDGMQTTPADGAETTPSDGMETTPGDGPGDGTTGTEGQPIEELAFGERGILELDEGDYTISVSEAATSGTDTTTPGDGDVITTPPGDGEETTPESDGEAEATTTPGGSEGMTATTTPGDTDTAGDAGSDRGFQVQVLEDDITDPGEGTARLRVFHAVPDVDAVSISATADGETGDTANETGDGAVAGTETTPGTETDTGTDDDETREAEFTADSGTAYSGFAVGYFDPEAAATEESQDGNETDDEGEADGGLLDGGNETGEGQGEEDLAQDADGEEFELVTVEDAQGGERADGGTNGLLQWAPVVQQ